MDPGRDLEDARQLFEDPAFRPDMVKVYPTLVLPGTPLFEDWKNGRYHPYDDAAATEVLAKWKGTVPRWVRIQRIQRDIPARLIAAGVRSSNIRELALRRLESEGGRCRCLRCREVGRRATGAEHQLELRELEYAASRGRELFLAWEDPETDAVAGFLRLRFPSTVTEGGLTDPVIRELKVLGVERAVGAASDGAYQHRGLGAALLKRAEERARSDGFDRIFVTSAVGTREYYRRHGYAPVGAHMAKPTYSGRNVSDGAAPIS